VTCGTIAAVTTKLRTTAHKASQRAPILITLFFLALTTAAITVATTATVQQARAPTKSHWQAIYRSGSTRHVDSNWQLYAQQKQAISPAGSPHWYRLNLYNHSKETQYLTLSITPLRLRAATIFLHKPHEIETDP